MFLKRSYSKKAMNSLKEIIIDKIKRDGPVTFEAFMEMALYYPELGYYASSAAHIGKKGDFYTSPHLHSIFGAMIGTQLMEMWEFLGKPDTFHVVEMGAGLGYLCKDILDYLNRPANDPAQVKDRIDFQKSLTYIIVEPYPHLEEKQRTIIKDSLQHYQSAPLSKEKKESAADEQKVRWIKSLNELGTAITGCIVSNELLDAFPVHLVEMEGQLREIYIDTDGEELSEIKGSVSSDEIISYLNTFSIELKPGYRTEINLRIKNWLKAAASALSRGFILTIDYGYTAEEYYSDDRTNGTLLCYHKHLYNDNPYQHIGEQDITAHVNFSSVKMWGEEHGLKTVGYSAQGIYLISSGIDELIVELYANSPDYLSEVSKIKGLIMPQGMGESHSVMIQYKGDGLPVFKGFTMRNNAGSL